MTPISLFPGDGIERKLEIEKAVTDVAELNGELRNRQYLVEQLTKQISAM